MKAVMFKSLGGPEVLEIVEQEKTAPKDGEVLIRVTSAGLNRADALFRQGRYLVDPKLPSRSGLEAAGIVEAVGGKVPFKAGDRVAALPGTIDASKQGGVAEYVTLAARTLLPTPKSVSDADAGAVWMQFLTAWGALNHAVVLRKDMFVVITAGSSSVALAAIQLANHLGAIPIVTTTNAAKIGKIKACGATHVIDVKSENYVERVKQITDGHGVEVVFDPVGGRGTAQHLEIIRPMGTIFIYGALDLAPVSFAPGLLIGKNITLRGYTLFPLLMDEGGLATAAKAITEGLDSGRFKLNVDRRFPMSEVREAHKYLESNAQVGKVVINP